MILNEKETFIYIATSIQHAIVLQELDKETQTRVLIKMVEKFCPRLKYSEWIKIFQGVEEIKLDLMLELKNCLTHDQLLNIADRHLKVFKFSQEDYLKKYSEIKSKIDIDKVLEGL